VILVLRIGSNILSIEIKLRRKKKKKMKRKSGLLRSIRRSKSVNLPLDVNGPQSMNSKPSITI
jgi:hypothetical protein